MSPLGLSEWLYAKLLVPHYLPQSRKGLKQKIWHFSFNPWITQSILSAIGTTQVNAHATIIFRAYHYFVNKIWFDRRIPLWPNWLITYHTLSSCSNFQLPNWVREGRWMRMSSFKSLDSRSVLPGNWWPCKTINFNTLWPWS